MGNIYRKLKWIFSRSKRLRQPVVVFNEMYVTIDWAGNPITTKGDGYILPRRAEMVLNAKYYPNGKIGEWPCNPITGEKLPIEPNEFTLLCEITK